MPLAEGKKAKSNENKRESQQGDVRSYCTGNQEGGPRPDLPITAPIGNRISTGPMCLWPGKPPPPQLCIWNPAVP